MQPDAAVNPARRHQAELPALRARRPEVGDHSRVVGRQAEHLISEARRRGVTDQQDRHGKAERDADDLDRRQAERAPLVDRQSAIGEMNRRRAVERNRARQAVPDLDRDLHSGFGGVERDQAERVIDQMRADVSEKDEAGPHPQGPAHLAGEPIRENVVTPGAAYARSSRDVSPLETKIVKCRARGEPDAGHDTDRSAPKTSNKIISLGARGPEFCRMRDVVGLWATTRYPGIIRFE